MVPAPSEIFQVTRKVVAAFDAARIRYFLGGSVASANDSSLIDVASPEDTILAKFQWYRHGGEVSDRQWNDVLGVLKVQGPALDRAYLDEWAKELGLTDLLRRAIDEAGLSE